jgi:imidazolonepropionase-like amidohydrolase
MKHLTTLSLLILTGLTACSAVASASEPDQQATRFAIKNVSVVDVEMGVVHPNQIVLVSGKRIEQIGDRAWVAIPKDATVIDGQGLYLMPGLVDAHVHYYEAPTFGRLMIANGVLLVRDMGMPNEYILPLRDQQNRGEMLGPEIVTTGAILDGSQPVIPMISMSIENTEQARAAVRAQVSAGVDMIKVYSNLDRDMFLEILAEAERLGLKVVGHVPDSIYIEDAVSAGMDSIEHWFGFEKVIAKLLGDPVNLTYIGIGAGFDYLLRLDEVDPQLLHDFYQRLRASGVTIDPTIFIFKNWPNVDSIEAENLPNGEYVSQDLLSFWKTSWAGQTEFPDLFWQNWAQMVRDMNSAGVPLMVGTDLTCPAVIPGFSVHEEMVIWQEAGIPTKDILRSATIVPAKFLGLEDRLGSIGEGKTASMVLVRANPLEDIRNAQQIESVFLQGEYLNRAALDKLLDEAKALAQQPTTP